MDPYLATASITVFPPAILVLYLFLRPYSGKINEPKAFIALMIGMITGMFSGIMHLFTEPLLIADPLAYVLTFPIFEAMFLTVIMNSSAYRPRLDAPLYGICVGVGYGMLITFVIAYSSFAGGGDFYLSIGLYAFTAVPMSIIFGSVAAYVALGPRFRSLWSQAFKSAVMLMPHYIMILIFSMTMEPVALAGMLIYALIVGRFTAERVLPLALLKR
jgi:hypothetical protein